MIRTGIYGGSFNPIHNGHVQLAEHLLRCADLDEIWFLVSPLNPLKSDCTDILNDAARLEMAQCAVGNHSKLRVSDFEFNLPRPSYMLHTLQKLTATYPERLFSLIIGADNWHDFPRWYHHEDIVNHYHIYVYPRPGFDINPDELPESVNLVHTPLLPISSTEIRQRIKLGKSISEYVDSEVNRLIIENGYYK